MKTFTISFFGTLIVGLIVITTSIIVGKYFNIQRDIRKDNAIQDCLETTSYESRFKDEAGRDIYVKDVVWDTYERCVEDKNI
ncbi:hypothetical protein KC678_01105 [Candidatus Dojkabacteria bacterium]|uniref:Uncharacterized protein n=1 Tax=Candidatus Dojkabacteria bacterium TaxID=2099670 RepID=A0A955L1K6_9BACT|nr:hypothetical protein [Candidatus Dojkabacteria bacterium]